MDVNDLRVMVTVLSFVAFIGIVIWVVARRNAARFDEAAQLPFQEAADAQPVVKERARRAERRAAPKPAHVPSGDRPRYPSDEGLQ